ncbi:FAD-dependent oxidoreductase [Pseudomonas syringae]|uniref:FAD-dependent oxidoreductase n=1 Tax=Pseudomonas syringae TaxID=317 RepID=UPI001F24FBF2|nr:FAD-dependent oxidoreductase [Pseudomonas syringae]MCF5722809.1 FAD-binding protein [Pseudomonas syringae]
MNAVNNVLIVGGGIGGLCAAIALRQKGIDVYLVELQSKWSVYGVGIIQQSNVIREMARLGVLNDYLSVAYAFDDVGVYNSEGEQLALIPGHRLAGPEYPSNVGISRRALHQVLIDKAQSLGARIELGLTVNTIEQDSNGVDILFSDGSKGRYDLVVGSDGLFSKIRSLIFGDKYKPKFTGQSVWRYNFPRSAKVDHLANFQGADGNAGLCPLSDEVMYMYITSHEPTNPWMEQSVLASEMRKRLNGFGGIIGELREQIIENSEVVYKPLEAVFVDESWFRGRVLLIGDAAHSTTPHLGQGAGMAIEDAVVLGEELVSGSDVDAQLQRFMNRRFERCKYIYEKSLLSSEKEVMRDHDFDKIGLVKEMLEVTSRPI